MNAQNVMEHRHIIRLLPINAFLAPDAPSFETSSKMYDASRTPEQREKAGAFALDRETGKTIKIVRIMAQMIVDECSACHGTQESVESFEGLKGPIYPLKPLGAAIWGVCQKCKPLRDLLKD